MGKGDRKKHKKKKKQQQPIQPKKRNERVINNSNDLKMIKEKSSMENVSFEIINEKLEYSNNNPIHFLKWHYSDTKKLNDFKEKIKIVKTYEIDLEGNTESELDIETLSGIIPENELNKTVQKLIPYSFILKAKIKLIAPYFSHDDDNFYLIQNPCLKEKVYKVPMIRGSGWKGAIARAGKELINEDFKWFSSYVRIFGTGSDEYRKLIYNIVEDKDFKENLIRYLLFELGKRLTKDDITQINGSPEEYLKNLNVNKNDFKNISYLQVHKGRAIFYPTYFNRLSLEIINPHNRKTRAGTNPIHYEVVPKDTEGNLQIIYIPFDVVLSNDEDVKNQVERDIEFLTKCIEKVAEIGVGAKEKLGWGRFEFVNRIYCLNKEIEDLSLQNWQKCEVRNG